VGLLGIDHEANYELKARAETQQATRDRIAATASALHEEVGVAKTTVADIARRAGVQRLTVYNHFPDLEALLPACTAHWMEEHPLPDLAARPRDRGSR
jgi:AcrR family transcriptional regulator